MEENNKENVEVNEGPVGVEGAQPEEVNETNEKEEQKEEEEETESPAPTSHANPNFNADWAQRVANANQTRDRRGGKTSEQLVRENLLQERGLFYELDYPEGDLVKPTNIVVIEENIKGVPYIIVKEVATQMFDIEGKFILTLGVQGFVFTKVGATMITDIKDLQ